MFETNAIVHVISQPSKIKHDTKCLITALVDENIATFYRHLTNRALHINLIKPSWKAHVTISKINTEVPMHMDKKKISIRYSPFVRYSGDNPIAVPTPEWTRKIGKFWFVDVWSDDIQAIRQELELPDYDKFHVTIGFLENVPPNIDKKLSRFV